MAREKYQMVNNERRREGVLHSRFDGGGGSMADAERGYLHSRSLFQILISPVRGDTKRTGG